MNEVIEILEAWVEAHPGTEFTAGWANVPYAIGYVRRYRFKIWIGTPGKGGSQEVNAEVTVSRQEIRYGGMGVVKQFLRFHVEKMIRHADEEYRKAREAEEK